MPENTSIRFYVPNVWYSAFGTEFNLLYQEIRWFSAYIWYGNFRSKWRSVIRDLTQIFYEIILNMFLITFNIPVPFTTLLEAFRIFEAKKRVQLFSYGSKISQIPRTVFGRRSVSVRRFLPEIKIFPHEGEQIIRVEQRWPVLGVTIFRCYEIMTFPVNGNAHLLGKVMIS